MFDLDILAADFLAPSSELLWGYAPSCVRDLDRGNCCGTDFGDGRGFPCTLTTSFKAALYASIELVGLCVGGGLSDGSIAFN